MAASQCLTHVHSDVSLTSVKQTSWRCAHKIQSTRRQLGECKVKVDRAVITGIQSAEKDARIYDTHTHDFDLLIKT